jgi:hypothetical protein
MKLSKFFLTSFSSDKQRSLHVEKILTNTIEAPSNLGVFIIFLYATIVSFALYHYYYLFLVEQDKVVLAHNEAALLLKKISSLLEEITF